MQPNPKVVDVLVWDFSEFTTLLTLALRDDEVRLRREIPADELEFPAVYQVYCGTYEAWVMVQAFVESWELEGDRD